MRTWIVTLVCAAVLTPVTSTAQSVTIEAQAADLRLGPVVIIPVRLDRGTRHGYLAELAWSPGVYSVVVWHPSRSGFGGSIPIAGLCIEPTFTLPPGDWWQFTPPRDGDGDGDDDLVLLEVTGAQRFRVVNLDLNACR